MRNWVLLTRLDFDPVTDDRAVLQNALDSLCVDASRKMNRGSSEVRGYYAGIVDELAPSKRPEVEAALFDYTKRHRMADEARALVYGEIDRFAKLNPEAVDKVYKNVRSSVRAISMIPDWDIDEAVVRSRIEKACQAPSGSAGAVSQNPVETYNRYVNAHADAIAEPEQRVRQSCTALGVGDLYHFLETQGLRSARTASDSAIIKKLEECHANPKADTQEHSAAISILADAGIAIISSGGRQAYDALLAKRGIERILSVFDIVDSGSVVSSDVAQHEVVELTKYVANPQEAPLVLLGCLQSKGLVCGASYDELVNAATGKQQNSGAWQNSNSASGNAASSDDIRERARREFDRANEERAKAASDPAAETARQRAYESDYKPTSTANYETAASQGSSGKTKGNHGCLIKGIIGFVIAAILFYVVLGLLRSGGAFEAQDNSDNGNGGNAEPSEIVVDEDYQGTLYPASTSSDGPVGYVGKNGRWAIAPKFTELSQFNDGLALQKDSLSGLYGYIDTKGNWAISGKYDRAGDFQDGLAWIQTDDGKYQFIDTSGNVAIEGPFDACSSFGEGFAWVVYPTKDNPLPSTYSIIDTEGNVVVSETEINSGADAPGEFHDGLSVFRGNDGYGYADTKGEVAIKAVYGKATPFGNGAAAVYSKEAEKWGYIDTNGTTVLDPRCTYATRLHDGYAGVSADGKYMIISPDGYNAVADNIEGSDPFNDGLASALTTDKELVFIDKTGDIAVKLDSAVRFVETYPLAIYE